MTIPHENTLIARQARSGIIASQRTSAQVVSELINLERDAHKIDRIPMTRRAIVSWVRGKSFCLRYKRGVDLELSASCLILEGTIEEHHNGGCHIKYKLSARPQQAAVSFLVGFTVLVFGMLLLRMPDQVVWIWFIAMSFVAILDVVTRCLLQQEADRNMLELLNRIATDNVTAH